MRNRFPFCRQLDSRQCGIASVAMISRFYGKKYSLRFLEGKCDLSREGISLKALHDLVQNLGFSSQAGRLTLSQLRECQLPAILHWNQNHFVVLYRIKGDCFHIADPGKGLRRIRIGEFAEKWLDGKDIDNDKGIALFLEPGENFGSIEDDASNPEFSWSLLIDHFREYRGLFLKIALCLLLVTGIQLIFPFLTQAIVDKGIHAGDLGFIWLILLGEMMLVAGRMVADFVRNRLLLRMSVGINISMVSGFFKNLLKLPMSFFDTRLLGDLLERMADHTRVQNFMTGDVLNIILSVLSFIIFGIVLLVYDGIVFLVFIIGCVAYSVWVVLFLRKRRELDYEYFDKNSLCQGRTVEFLSTIQEIKLQNCEYKRRREWEEAQRNLFDVRLEMLRQQQMQEAGSIFINEAKNILVTVMTASAVIKGEMTLGMMLAVQYIIGQLNSPIDQLVKFLYSLQSVKISLERIGDIDRSEKEVVPERTIGKEQIGKESITLKNLNFKYDRSSSKNILKDVSVIFPAGKITAVVGASGAGKTTLLKLMLGYYKTSPGEVTVGQSPLENIILEDWRKQCGVVMQDGVIFSDTIEGNIAGGDPNVDYDRLRDAARIACIESFIDSLPLKYKTRIGKEGVGLSAGQRQRILIARAVYRDPEFIFLDEATNSLDAKNEREIVENLRRFYRGRTVVVVAHRLSTVCDADKIVVLDAGTVVETGTHDELIALRGAYYNLVRNQLELGT